MSKEVVGIGFCEVLFFIFLTLKLMKVIDWSWWWVTAPLWAPFGFGVSVGIVCLIVYTIVLFITKDL